jgi:hypothetical protein
MQLIFENIIHLLTFKDFLLLFVVWIVITFLTFRIKEVNLFLFKKIIVLCILWWSLIVLAYPPHGDDYMIYSYNASLTLKHKDAFSKSDKKFDENWENPKYLDYTGAQHLLYIAMQLLSFSNMSYIFYGFGFQLWSIITFIICAWLILSLGKIKAPQDYLKEFRLLLLLTFNPVMLYFFIISSWEDKMMFIIIPLLIFYLLRKGKLSYTSIVIGSALTFNGLTAIFLPVYLIYIYRKDKKHVFLHLGLIILSALIVFIPFFPESLNGWNNRIIRISSENAFRYSIYKLFPSNLYSPMLYRAITFLATFMLVALFWLKKINLYDGLLFSLYIIVILSPYNSIVRAITLIFVTVVFIREFSLKEWFYLNLIFLLFFMVRNGIGDLKINYLSNFIFQIPMIWIFIMYLKKRKLSSQINAT